MRIFPRFPTLHSVFRSNRSQQFNKNFANFTGKHLCWSLFLIKMKACNYIKMRDQNRYFPVKFTKLLKLPFFTEHLGRLLLCIPLLDNFDSMTCQYNIIVPYQNKIDFSQTFSHNSIFLDYKEARQVITSFPVNITYKMSQNNILKHVRQFAA